MTGSATAVEVPAPAAGYQFGPADVTLFAERIDGDRGSYPLAAATFVDELTAEGIDAQPWHDLDHSDWYGERDPILVTLILGIATNAAWDAIKLLLGRRRGGQVKLVAGFQRGDEVRWIQAEGDAAAVADAIDRLNPFDGP